MRWRSLTDAVGTIAVVLSLVYVGVQVRQNTSAIQTNTSQSVYTQYSDVIVPVLESEALAEVISRAGRAPESMSASDSIQYDMYLNLRINVLEAVYTNSEQGTLEVGMARGWLEGMGPWKCRPGGEEYWRANAANYAPNFRMAMDSAIAVTECPT